MPLQMKRPEGVSDKHSTVAELDKISEMSEAEEFSHIELPSSTKKPPGFGHSRTPRDLEKLWRGEQIARAVHESTRAQKEAIQVVNFYPNTEELENLENNF